MSLVNPEKGEFLLTVNGKRLVLVMGTNALIALQHLFSPANGPIVPIEQIRARLDEGSLEHVRAVIWACLQKYHPEYTTPAQVGDLMDEAGGIDGLAAHLSAVGRSMTPDPKDLETLGVDTARPPRARRGRRAGTGTRSTGTADRSGSRAPSSGT